MVTIVNKMLTVLKPGYEKILRLFYSDKTAKFHLREIARQTKLHEPSATRFLNALEKNGLLKAERDGNLKKYSVKKTNRLYVVFAMFDVEKLHHLPAQRKNAILYYLHKLPEQPVYAVLFGSTAKETYSENSDLDLLIITNKKIETKEAEKEADALTSIKVSTFQITYNNFLQELKMKEDKVVQSALQTGYPVLNHLHYYEALYHEGI